MFRSSVVSAFLLPLALAACGSSAPAHVVRHGGLGGSSLVYVEGLDVARTASVGRPVPATPSELASRFRVRLLQRLRDQGMQTRDATGGVPRDGVLVNGTLDTIDGGTTEGVKVGGQRLHCTVRLWNGAQDRSEPAFELRITGTPSVTDVLSETGATLAAADDAADQIAKFIRENP